MDTRQLRLWQLISSTLPVGTYHFSEGLEHAVHKGAICTSDDLQDWLAGLLLHSLAQVDLPITLRAMRAWRVRDDASLRHWDKVCTACRETSELRDENQQMGAALARLARSLDSPFPARPVSYTVGFAVMAVNWDLADDEAMTGYAWSWLENQIAAAVKLFPLGQTAGQRLLIELTNTLHDAVAAAYLCEDEDIGVSAPGFALMSAGHETQYSRLFRS